ncbi:MAG TPA: GGDEF domain-containing protein [Acidimicrobiales bacterium]|nr:GGDEF domain-containing protein [Acidimicrobiales bacterium]
MAAAFDSARGDQSGPLTTSVDVIRDRELHRWEERCRHDAALSDAPWPKPQALALVDAILESLASSDTSAVDAAARAWARSSPSVSTLVRQMGALREVLASDDVCAFPDLDDRLVRIMDQATVTATAAALAELEDAALTDALTGVGNRRALETAATAALASADRADHVVSVVVVDLDGLKAINDTHGHAAGDHAIGGLTEALRRSLRDSDQLFRIGGDEFVALLPLAPVETVTELMARAADEAPAFSWGVASAPDDGTELDALLDAADQRLYERRRRTRAGSSRGSARAAAATPAVGVGATLPVRDAEVLSASTTLGTPTVARTLRTGTGAGASRRARARRTKAAVAVVLASAGLGITLHVLTAPGSGGRGHQGAPGSGPAPGVHSLTGGTRGSTPSSGPGSGAGPGPGTGTGTGRSAGAPGSGSGTGTAGTGGGATSGDTPQAAMPGSTTSTTTPAASTTTLLPGLPQLPTTTVLSTLLP